MNMCQSCGMPLTDNKLFGSEKNGVESTEYCVYCYENGEFKQPGITLADMVEICVPHVKETGLSEEKARALLNEHLPNLKRWKSK